MLHGKLIRLLLAGALLIAANAGCGGSVSSSPAESNAHRRTGVGSSQAATWQRVRGPYLNDGDLDPIGDRDGDNGRDVDNDPSLDYKPIPENHFYLDADDGQVIRLGGPQADSADRRAIKALVERYFAAASADNGRRACAMLAPGSARKVPRYANSWSAPAYMRGGRTCAATMDRLFRHFHHRLSSRVVVTDVRSRGGRALAVLGSKTMPARDVEEVRERGAWWLEIPLAGDPLLANDLS